MARVTASRLPQLLELSAFYRFYSKTLAWITEKTQLVKLSSSKRLTSTAPETIPNDFSRLRVCVILSTLVVHTCMLSSLSFFFEGGLKTMP